MSRTGDLRRGALAMFTSTAMLGSGAALASDLATTGPDAAVARLAHPLCRQAHPDDKCQAGGGRRTTGGGDKASHEGWPAITGVFWQVTRSDGRTFNGGRRADELLGHHGSDRIRGGGSRDVIWGDWQRGGNDSWQHDILSGQDGRDVIYSSHGHNVIRGGRGNDLIWAFYGRGRIDCGPGIDTLRLRRHTPFTYVRCERFIR